MQSAIIFAISSIVLNYLLAIILAMVTIFIIVLEYRVKTRRILYSDDVTFKLNLKPSDEEYSKLKTYNAVEISNGKYNYGHVYVKRLGKYTCVKTIKLRSI